MHWLLYYHMQVHSWEGHAKGTCTSVFRSIRFIRLPLSLLMLQRWGGSAEATHPWARAQRQLSCA